MLHHHDGTGLGRLLHIETVLLESAIEIMALGVLMWCITYAICASATIRPTRELRCRASSVSRSSMCMHRVSTSVGILFCACAHLR